MPNHSAAARGNGTGAGAGTSRNGAARYALPFVAAVAAILFVVVLVYPIMKLSPHDVPAAVLTLDAGAEVDGERVDAGAELVDRLTGADGEGEGIGGDVLAWTVLGSREELDAAMESGEYYLALVVPEDFSERMAAQQGREQLGAALVERLPELADGAAALASGAQALADATTGVSSGLESLALDAAQLPALAGQLAGSAGQLAAGAASLSDGLAGANATLQGLPPDDGAPQVQVIVNQGKNPMVTNSVEPSLVAFEAMGIEVETSYSVELPAEMQRGFSHMPLMIMTYLTSYIAGAVIALRLPPSRDSRRGQARGLLVQAGVAVGVAAFVGAACALVYQAMLGVGVDWASLALLMGLSSLALQLVVVGCLDLFGVVGMLVPLLLMAFCMTSAYLPYEFLPSFWQDNIYPWNPLRHMVDSYKAVIYLGQGAWNASTPYVLAVLAAGVAVMALNLLKRPRAAR